ncbi:MAG TPA: hypothetical protein VG033_11085 [Candidatus Acidoferrales bacterium]|nr:hypothetical protein [Candidatus Acidoferrales bacterium]
MSLAAGAVLLVGLWILISWRQRPRDPHEIERRRRLRLNQIGRIVEGQVLEIVDRPRDVPEAPRGLFAKRESSMPAGNGMHKLLFYTYSISGVTYETAQDISGLEERAALHRVVVGQPASVKYDPANPSNSILVADDWSGLH